jgi:hypothetical protein
MPGDAATSSLIVFTGKCLRGLGYRLRNLSRSEDMTVIQLYLSALGGVVGRVVYDAYNASQPVKISGTRILVSAILITAVFTWVYSRSKEAMKGLPVLMRFFVGFQLGFIADSLVNALL